MGKRELSDMPETVVGQWLFVALLGEDDRLRDRLHRRLNSGQSGWKSFDEASAVEAAGELAARRLLPLDANRSRIAAMAADMQSKMHANAVRGPEVILEVIRAALGYQNVDFKNISNNDIFTAYGGIVGYAYFKLGMDKPALARLIADAEEISFGRGWKPPIADKSASE